MNCSHVTIFQAYDLEEKLEEVCINRDRMTIDSTDAINMYPSIKLMMIKKAVRIFSKEITAATKNTLSLCLELVCFGMGSTLIAFGVEYYEYNGGVKK